MEVRLYSNSSRPGVGLKPRRESQRPLLPQHARHCPVLEAGSALGWLVYPPLEPNESFHIEYEGEGRYQLIYMSKTEGAKWEPVFTVEIVLPIGSIGMMREEVHFAGKRPPISRDTALGVMRALIVPEDLGTPPGAISLRGATNFKTPAGWDTVYTPIFNMIDRPVAPMLVVRVETDWYAHAEAWRRYTGRAQHADRTGVLCIARRGPSCRMHTRGIGGHPDVAARILSSQSLQQDHDAVRPGVQSPLPSPKPLTKF